MPTITEINRELADKVVAEASQNPSAYPGKYIGIANGQVVIVSDDLDAVDDRLDEVESDPSRTYVVDLTLDPKKVEYIWGTP
jgi:tetrahydromethanopterin S-methyltransferase subunit G